MRRILSLTLLFAIATSAVNGQTVSVKSSDAALFIGTWAFDMSNPQGAHETVRIWDKHGVIAASVQAERFPPLDVSGVLKDGDMLVLTLTRFENGKPIRAVITLIADGDSMRMAQMLEFSTTIKRGAGKRQ